MSGMKDRLVMARLLTAAAIMLLLLIPLNVFVIPPTLATFGLIGSLPILFMAYLIGRLSAILSELIWDSVDKK